MAKRPIGTTSFNQPSTSKRQKTFDPYKLLESMEKLSIGPEKLYIATTSFTANNISSFSKVRNERENNTIKWHEVPRIKDKHLVDLKMALETLKFKLLKLHCCKSEDINMDELFTTVLIIITRLEFKSTHCGRFTDIEHFVKQEFSFKQAEMFSEQYHVNEDMKKSNNYITSRGISLLADEPVCNGERHIFARQLIECIAQIVSASKEFSEMMLTKKLDSEYSQSIPSTSEQQTMIDLVWNTIKSLIKDNRYIARHFGLVVAVTHLLQSLTSHYDKYSDKEDINKGLELMFTLVLQIATFDVEIMLSLSESFVNITHKNPNRMTLFKSFCISYPHKNLEYSWAFRLMRMDLCPGCKFQIFFLLLNHAFRFYDAEKITGDRLDALIQLTKNMNYLAFIFLANDVDIKFLVPYKGYTGKVDDACYCYRYLLYCTLILNDILLKNQNSNPDYYQIMFSIRKDSIIILNALLSYTYNSPDFFKINPLLSMMNEIYSTLNFVDLHLFNPSRTRILIDVCKVFELYIKQNPKKPNAPMNPFKLFLKKFDPKNAKDYEMELYEDEDDSNQRRQSVRPLKYPAIKMSKEDLLKEIDDDLRADDCLTYSVEHYRKDK